MNMPSKSNATAKHQALDNPTQTDLKRRLFLKYMLVNSAVATTFCAGLLKPRLALANWPKSAFDATSIPDALTALYGSNETINKRWLTKISARPHMDDGGTQVTINITTRLADVESITILATTNKTPLVATFIFNNKDAAALQTRISMENKGDIITILKSGDRLFSETTEVDFSSCGCG